METKELLEKANGLYDAGKYEEALPLYLNLVSDTDAEIMLRIGVCYVEIAEASGHQETAYHQAEEWLLKAAALGNAEAQLELGHLYFYGYYYGRGVAKSDAQEAVKWYKLAAEQGNAEAQTWLGLCYQDGRGIEKNSQTALQWFHAAAKQNFPDALYYIAFCYSVGDGVEQDEQKATEWFQKAAELGDVDAMCVLGINYQNGDGVEKDISKAIYWYEMAAKNGDYEAMDILVELIDKGYEEAREALNRIKSD